MEKCTDLLKVLENLNPAELNYQEWVNVGMALKHEGYQVGKMMALGMGIGFDKNVPIKSMNASLKTAIGSLKDNASTVLSGGGVNRGGVGRMKALSDVTDGIDYDRLERIQMKAADKMAKRPIYLDKNRIDKPLPKGAVPVW